MTTWCAFQCACTKKLLEDSVRHWIRKLGHWHLGVLGENPDACTAAVANSRRLHMCRHARVCAEAALLCEAITHAGEPIECAGKQ